MTSEPPVWLDAAAVERDLAEDGAALVPELLDAEQCARVASWYEQPERFRSRIVMERHGYGRGEYQYFDYPLPPLVQELREQLYPPLAAIANEWQRRLGGEVRFPDSHSAFLERCRAAGQVRPTPLLLSYGEGDENRLHQDLYGQHVFPLQIAVLLSTPERDFSGGEFVMTEHRARRQSRPLVVPLQRGDAVIFAVAERPVLGKRGYTRAQMRHGVSRVRRGHRKTLGIIFHDAE